METMKIEAMERQWASPQVQEFAEYLQAKIAKEFTIHAHLLRPETAYEAERRAWARTEIMRLQLVRLIDEYSRVIFIASDAPQSNGAGQT